MSPEDAAWVAGLLEGEGSFIPIKRCASARISCQMTDLDILTRLHAVVGCGTVTPVRMRSTVNGTPRKQAWTWKTQRRADVERVISEIRPHMGLRRLAQIDLALARYKERKRR